VTTYDPKAIANFFIDAAAAEGRALTPLQIIKLVYIAHGWYLALTGQPLINEPPEAWQYGPVIPSLYHRLKIYGNGPVRHKITGFSESEWPNLRLAEHEVSPPQDKTVQGFLNSVWKAYGRFSGIQLSSLTHQDGTPWHQTWEGSKAKYSKGVDIPETMIREHYKRLNAERNVAGIK